MKKKILHISIISVLLTTKTLSASSEVMHLFPALGEIGKTTESSYIKGATKRFVNVQLYNNSIVYNDQIGQSINRYLVLKAMEIGIKSNASYKNNLQSIDDSFNEISNTLKSLSLEEKFKEYILGSGGFQAILDKYSWSKYNEEPTVKAIMSNLLKIFLDRPEIQKLITDVLNIEDTQYDVLKTFIVGSVDILIEYLDNGPATKVTLETFGKNITKYISTGVALYEAGLQTIQIGATAAALYDLAKTNKETSVDMWSTGFIYDYVNKFHGNIKEMRDEVRTYKFIMAGGIPYFRDNGEYTPDTYTPEYTFFDIFYWYTIKHLNTNDLSLSNWENLANIARAARKALDWIEDYGNGGNFRVNAKYTIDAKLGKKLSLVKSGSFNFMYYMPEIKSDDTTRNIHFKFYQYNEIPDLRSSARIFTSNGKVIKPTVKYILDFNHPTLVSQNKSTVKRYIINKKVIEKNEITNIAYKISPKITIEFYDRGLKSDKMTQTKGYKSFYLPYGFSATSLQNNGLKWGLTAFSDFYNRGYINTATKKFQPMFPINGVDFANALYGYIVKTSYYINPSSKTPKNLNWNACVNDGICGEGNLIKSQYDFFTREKVIDALVLKLGKKLDKIKRKYTTIPIAYSRAFRDNWTPSGKKLFQHGIISGGSDKNMNKDLLMNQIEMMAISKKLKDLLNENK